MILVACIGFALRQPPFQLGTPGGAPPAVLARAVRAARAFGLPTGEVSAQRFVQAMGGCPPIPAWEVRTGRTTVILGRRDGRVLGVMCDPGNLPRAVLRPRDADIAVAGVPRLLQRLDGQHRYGAVAIVPAEAEPPGIVAMTAQRIWRGLRYEAVCGLVVRTIEGRRLVTAGVFVDTPDPDPRVPLRVTAAHAVAVARGLLQSLRAAGGIRGVVREVVYPAPGWRVHAIRPGVPYHVAAGTVPRVAWVVQLSLPRVPINAVWVDCETGRCLGWWGRAQP